MPHWQITAACSPTKFAVTRSEITIIESGVIIFLGMLLLGLKLKTKTSLTLLGYPLALDFSVSSVSGFVYYRTFSGVMAAAVAGLMCRFHDGRATHSGTSRPESTSPAISGGSTSPSSSGRDTTCDLS